MAYQLSANKSSGFTSTSGIDACEQLFNTSLTPTTTTT